MRNEWGKNERKKKGGHQAKKEKIHEIEVGRKKKERMKKRERNKERKGKKESEKGIKQIASKGNEKKSKESKRTYITKIQ